MNPIVNGVGNLTKDVILEYTQKSNTPVARFTVAFNGARSDDTCFLWCVAYNKAAENIAKFLKKGSPIQILGELSQYNDEAGKSHTYCNVIRFAFIRGAGQKESAPPIRESESAQDDKQGETDEPF